MYANMFAGWFKKTNQHRKQAYEAGFQQKVLINSRRCCGRRSDCFFIFCCSD